MSHAGLLIVVGGVLQVLGYGFLARGLWKLRKRPRRIYMPLIDNSGRTLPTAEADPIGPRIDQVADAATIGDRYLLDWIEPLHSAIVGRLAWVSLGCIVVGVVVSTVGGVLALGR